MVLVGLEGTILCWESEPTALLPADPRAQLAYELQELSAASVGYERPQFRRCERPSSLPEPTDRTNEELGGE